MNFIVITILAVSYVDANKIGLSSLDIKLRIMCLMVSVESTVEIPSLLPSKDAKVLLPVPDVPANRIIIFLFDSNIRWVT
jgi:hypothetical protein